MPITKQKKSEVLDNLRKQFSDSKIVLFVNFHGLSVALTKEARRLMSAASAKYIVAKKTLIKKVFSEEKISGEMPDLQGEVALVFGNGDVVTPPKSLVKFSKKHPEISVLGGIMEMSFLDKNSIIRLANLPTKEVLIAQFVNVINAPRKGLVVSLSGVMRNFVSVLSQINK